MYGSGKGKARGNRELDFQKSLEGLRAEAEEIPVTDPRMARNWPGSLWRLKMTGAPGKDSRAEFRVRRAGKTDGDGESN